MSDALSIFAAAREAGRRLALRTQAGDFTFAELADLAQARIAMLGRVARDTVPYPVIGSNTIETVVTLYALLERRVPALLVHPRLTEPERERLLAGARRLRTVPAPDIAAVVHTSGTTGTPRAALLGRAAFLASAEASAANLGWQDDDCWFLTMPLAHVGGFSILTRCLMARRCVALESHFDADAFPSIVAQRGVTLVSLVPTMLTRVLDAHPEWSPAPKLRAILLGGAAASARLLGRSRRRGLPILVSYGMTETCSQITTTPYAARFDPARECVGAALPGMEVRVRAEQIEVRGSTLMHGYWGEAPLAEGAWFPTGDLGAIDADGRLRIHARRQDLIVTGGENVYPVEVEEVLESIPGVRAAAVFGVPDETWGQIVAAVLVGDPDVATTARIAQRVDAQLAPHKHPRRLCFVPELPQTRGGKLDRPALAAFADRLRPLPPRPADEPATAL